MIKPKNKCMGGGGIKGNFFKSIFLATLLIIRAPEVLKNIYGKFQFEWSTLLQSRQHFNLLPHHELQVSVDGDEETNAVSAALCKGRSGVG